MYFALTQFYIQGGLDGIHVNYGLFNDILIFIRVNSWMQREADFFIIMADVWILICCLLHIKMTVK